MQIVYGLLCVADCCPVAVEAFPGNASDRRRRTPGSRSARGPRRHEADPPTGRRSTASARCSTTTRASHRSNCPGRPRHNPAERRRRAHRVQKDVEKQKAGCGKALSPPPEAPPGAVPALHPHSKPVCDQQNYADRERYPMDLWNNDQASKSSDDADGNPWP